jgi:hypothetical protein
MYFDKSWAAAWRSKRSWFLIAEKDHMINPKTQHLMADRMQARTDSFAVNHKPFLIAPIKPSSEQTQARG